MADFSQDAEPTTVVSRTDPSSPSRHGPSTSSFTGQDPDYTEADVERQVTIPDVEATTRP